MVGIALPAQLGPYRVLGVLGRGGMGVVYQAIDERLRRQVAIKALPPELLRSQERRERFAAEARAQAKLQHPNIVAVHHLLEVAQGTYLVMELFGRRSLEDLLGERKGHGLGEGEALRLMAQVLSALDYAHSQGIIHRDVKPGNVFVGADGSVKLGDFGIALLLGEARRTQAAENLGTPLYMAPEQILKPRSLDHRADIYSAGVLLFELLAGHPPFTGVTDYEIQSKHLRESPDALIVALAGVRPFVRGALARALRKDPAERFSSAAAFLRALREPDSVPAAAASAERREPPPSRTRALGRVLAAVLLAAGLALCRLAGWPSWPPWPGSQPQISNSVLLIDPRPAVTEARPSPPPPPPERPAQETRSPSGTGPAAAAAEREGPAAEAIRRRTVARLRRELALGISDGERLLAEGNPEEVRSKVEALVNLSRSYRTDLVEEMAALELLARRATEGEIARRTEQRADELRQQAAQEAWQRRLQEIESLIAELAYPEAVQLARKLLEEPTLPEEVAVRARELLDLAETGLKELWMDAETKTEATLVNPKRKKPVDLDREDRDDHRKGGEP